MHIAAAGIDLLQRTGVGLEAGCQYDVKLVQILSRLNAGLGDLLDRLAVLDVDEPDVAVIGSAVVQTA